MNAGIPCTNHCASPLLPPIIHTGKTTLLRILAGKHMVGGKETVRVLGRSAFHDTALTCDGDLAYLGGSWSKTVGCAVSELKQERVGE